MGWFSTNTAIAQVGFKDAVAYRATMLLTILSDPLYLFANYFIWTAIYAASETTTLGGLTLEQMITYLAITTITGHILWDDMDEHISESIEKGELTRYLLAPISFLRYNLMVKAGHRSLCVLIETLPSILVLGFLFGFGIFATKNLHWYIALLIVGTVTSFYVRVLLGMAAFWTTQIHGIRWTYLAVVPFLDGGYLPLSLFPEFVQKIFFFLPFQFASYAPARVFFGDYQLAGITLSPPLLVLYGIVHIIILYLVVRVIWHFSIRRYCGAGT